MLVSILIPVYNERPIVEKSLDKVLQAPLPESLERELIIVDDCSTDGTWDILCRYAADKPQIRLYRHQVNQGKGAAVRSAIAYATGEFCLIQDADLEYDANEYPILMAPLLSGNADAVFGSRYLAGEQRRVLPFWHTMINRFLTLVSNVFSNLHVTDMETCYKVFRTDLLKSIPIRSNRFGFEPEITMKCAKRRLRIYEVPISYHGRSYEEGKKINWWDGVKALGVILKFWVIDDLYVEPYGKGTLINLTRTPNYIAWVAALLRPLLGDRVLEIGASTGTFSGVLMGKRMRYVAAEADRFYLHALKNRFLRTPNVSVAGCDPAKAGDFVWDQEFDTALCLNVLEGLTTPETTLTGLHRALVTGGNLLILTGQGKGLYGTVDQGMGQLRRYDFPELAALLSQAGFDVVRTIQVNKAGKLAWYISSRVLHRPSLSKMTLKIFDKTMWFWKLMDQILPGEGLSLIVEARKRA